MRKPLVIPVLAGLLFAALLGVSAVCVLPPAAGAPAPTSVRALLPSRPPGSHPGGQQSQRLILYGDSLSWEARRPFRAVLAAGGITDVTLRTMAGTALCDWLQQMYVDNRGLHPDAVVIEFSGNALTPCMKTIDGMPLAGDAYYAKYAVDAREALATFAPAATVFLAGSPISEYAQLRNDPDAYRLNHIYAALAAITPRARYIDAGAAVMINGRWTRTMPCLAHEPCAGRIDGSSIPVNVVRAPDGSHFCPVAAAGPQGQPNNCRVYSSGAYRYGAAMANAIVQELTRVGFSEQLSTRRTSSRSATASDAGPDSIGDLRWNSDF